MTPWFNDCLEHAAFCRRMAHSSLRLSKLLNVDFPSKKNAREWLRDGIRSIQQAKKERDIYERAQRYKRTIC
jgi:hypothetical protein